MRGFRRGFRRSRRRSPVGRTKTGRMKVWCPKAFVNIPFTRDTNGNFTDLFEIISIEDYAENFDSTQFTDLPTRRDTATVVRVVGSLTVDAIVPAGGANGVQYAAAFFTRSRSAVINEFVANPSSFFLHASANYAAPASFRTNMTRLNPMQWLPDRGYSGAFIEIPNPSGLCSDFYSHINREDQVTWNFDITQRRKLAGDECLYLVVSGNAVCEFDEQAGFYDILTRTLIHDD